MPEGADAPPSPVRLDVAAPFRRLGSWARRRPRLWLGTAVVLVLVAAVYVAVAVSGLRRIEQAWLEARALGELYQTQVTVASAETVHYRITAGDTIEERMRRTTLDYADAMASLAREAGAVPAVDPRVRRVRAVVVEVLRGVVRDSRDAARSGAFTLAPFPYATRVQPHLEAAMARWRLDEGRAPEPSPLPAMSRRRVTVPLHSESTGTRLLTYAGGRLLAIDIDAGRVDDLGTAAPTELIGDRLVVLQGGHAKVRSSGGDRTLGEADNLVRDGDHPSSVWLATWPEDGGDGPETVVRRVGLDGSIEVAGRRVVGYLTAAAGRWLVVATGGEFGFTVHDSERPAFRFRREAGLVQALAAGTLVWTDHARSFSADTVYLRDLARGVDRPIPAPVPGATVAAVALAPGNRRLAVAWRSPEKPDPRSGAGLGEVPGSVWLYDLADLKPTRTPLASGPFNATLAWSRDGTWLFALTQLASVQHSVIGVHRVGTTDADLLRIEGEFLSLTAL